MEARARAFFAAMNAGDADGAVALTRDDVVVVLGPHELKGHDALRELALQTDDQLDFETMPVTVERESDSVVNVTARRTQRWRATGAVAVQEDMRARFTFDEARAISRIELA